MKGLQLELHIQIQMVVTQLAEGKFGIQDLIDKEELIIALEDAIYNNKHFTKEDKEC